jgi:hypothetical protein
MLTTRCAFCAACVYILLSFLFSLQDRVVRYGFGSIPNSDAVFQWRSVHATFYTPMDLRAFPFDRQQLLIQVRHFPVLCRAVCVCVCSASLAVVFDSSVCS